MANPYFVRFLTRISLLLLTGIADGMAGF